MKLIFTIFCFCLFSELHAQIVVKSAMVSHYVMDTTNGYMNFYLGDRVETHRRQLVPKNANELGRDLPAVESLIAREVNGLTDVAMLCPILQQVNTIDSIRNGIGVQNKREFYHMKMLGPNTLAMRLVDAYGLYVGNRWVELPFVIANIENCGNVIVLQEQGQSAPIGYLIFWDKHWQFLSDRGKYHHQTTLNQLSGRQLTPELYKQSHLGDQLIVSETCNDVILFTASYDSVQFFSGGCLAFLGDTISLVDLSNVPLTRQNVRHYSRENRGWFAAQFIIGNELFGYDQEQRMLQKQTIVNERLPMFCGTVQKWLKSKEIVALPDSSLALQLVYDTYGADIREVFALPRSFREYELVNQKIFLQNSDYDMLCKSKQTGKYTYFKGWPSKHHYLYREALAEFSLPEEQYRRVSATYFRFEQNGLMGIYPLMQKGKYKSIGDYIGNYARYETTDGFGGWLTRSGEEVPDVVQKLDE